jgi:cytoskeletal protein RodZ
VIGRIVLILVCVLGVGVIYAWHERIYPFTPQQGTAAADSPPVTPTQVPPNENKPKAKTASKSAKTSPARSLIVSATPESGASGGAVAVSADVSTNANTTPQNPAVPVARAADPPPFPTVQQIIAGEPENTVREKYGDPDISSLTSKDGHIERTYVYTRDRGYSETVIHLEDGKVATAYTRSTPPPPTGISIPRRWHPEQN